MIHTSRRARARIDGGAVVLLATAVAAVALLGGGGPEDGCCPGADAAALDRPIDSGLDHTMDSLPNGVRYYVRAHPSSDDRTELRLVVDAGSVQESEDQRGLTYAVEPNAATASPAHRVLRGEPLEEER